MTDRRVSDERRTEIAESAKQCGDWDLAVKATVLLDLLADSDDDRKEIERLRRAHNDRTEWMNAHVARIEQLMATETRLTAERDEAIAREKELDGALRHAVKLEDFYKTRIAELEAQLGKEREECAAELDLAAQREGNDDTAYTLRRAAAAIRSRAPVKQEKAR